MTSIVPATGRGTPSTDRRAGTPARTTCVTSVSSCAVPGCGASASSESSAAQDAEQAAHLPERVPSGVADRAQRGGGRRRSLLGARRGAVGLHDDHRQRMGDDVMQLASDPGALDRGADRGLLVAFVREQPVALPQRVDLGTARATPRAERRRQQRRRPPSSRRPPARDTSLPRSPSARRQQRPDDRARRPDGTEPRAGPVRRPACTARSARRRPRPRSGPAPRTARGTGR